MGRLQIAARSAAVAASLAVLSACSTLAPQPAGIGRTVDISVEGWFGRSYRLHLPAKQAVPAPLVVVLHGAFANAVAIEAETGFSEVSDREGFVVAYPNGYGFLGWLRHWNAGHCCGSARALGVDDIAYLDDVIADASRRAHADPERIYVVGESNGAMMAHHYATQRSDRIAAFAAVAGTIGSRQDGEPLETIGTPRAPVPAFLIHGRADKTIPYLGSDPAAETAWLGVADAVAFWRENNGVTAEATSRRDGRVETLEWKSETGTTLVLASIDDWGHRWPSRRSTGTSFDAAIEIWRFFAPQRNRTHVAETEMEYR